MSKWRALLLTTLSVVSIFAYNNCSNKGFDISESLVTIASNASGPLTIVGNEANVMKLTISCNYINQPCVSVTICEPGTSNCQTIDKILIDTGSFGLRVFSSLVSVNLTQRTINGGNLTECVRYADNSSNWGPIKTADVVLGSLKASSIPIQIIDASYATVPTECGTPDSSPTAAGYNGILGVGIFTEDCGIGCANTTNNRVYYACSGSTCGYTAVPVAQQVSNPISFLPSDNNGVIFQLPSIPSAGSTTASGYVILGIGTRSNNTPTSANVFKADGNGYFKTTFNGTTLVQSFIDSGSNGLFFPGPANLPSCSSGSGASGFYCPTTTTTYTAYQSGSGSNTQVAVSFEIQNAAYAVTTSPNFMFNNIGGSAGDMTSSYDWGLPFYFGRTIFHGIDGKSSPLGTGPYWAW
ncbi:MAG: DUF3443 family protein [Bdellovibrionales bacterium]|nr:DUF3443 family protein [Bdellovibrionales bacterium]